MLGTWAIQTLRREMPATTTCDQEVLVWRVRRTDLRRIDFFIARVADIPAVSLRVHEATRDRIVVGAGQRTTVARTLLDEIERYPASCSYSLPSSATQERF